MLSYSGKKQGNKLKDIAKITAQMTLTDAVDEYQLNAQGDYFYFTNGTNKALYKTIKQAAGGSLVKQDYDQSIINAFSQAIILGVSESSIVAAPKATEQPVSPDTQEQVKDLIAEKIVIQPTIVPIQAQSEEQIIVWASETIEPQFEEVATQAETWTRENIALPVIAKGVKVYNDNIPEGEVRPREYVVISVDDEIKDVEFSDNKNQREESFVNIIIQGHGNTFENWVVETSDFIHSILRTFREKGKVRNIVNRNIGFDETTQTLSRSISFWLKYNS